MPFLESSFSWTWTFLLNSPEIISSKAVPSRASSSKVSLSASSSKDLAFSIAVSHSYASLGLREMAAAFLLNRSFQNRNCAIVFGWMLIVFWFDVFFQGHGPSFVDAYRFLFWSLPRHLQRLYAIHLWCWWLSGTATNEKLPSAMIRLDLLFRISTSWKSY